MSYKKPEDKASDQQMTTSKTLDKKRKKPTDPDKLPADTSGNYMGSGVDKRNFGC